MANWAWVTGTVEDYFDDITVMYHVFKRVLCQGEALG